MGRAKETKDGGVNLKRFDLILDALRNLNWRVSALEMDSEGRGAEDKRVREIVEELEKLQS